MTASQNKPIVSRFYDEVLTGGNIASLSKFVADSYVEHSPLPGQPPGVEGLALRLAMLRSAFSDMRYAIDDVVADGGKVAVRWTMLGTNDGPFLTRPATGKSVATTGIDIYRVEQGKIVEHWNEMDMLGLLQQLLK